jgi:hypothetical protein
MFGLLGAAMALTGSVICGYLAYVKLFGEMAAAARVGDRPSLLLGILLVFTGVQLFTSGLVAELLARTYHESQDKPVYVIGEVLEASDVTPIARETVAR